MDRDETEFIGLAETQRAAIYKVSYLYSPSRAEIDDLYREVLARHWEAWLLPRREQTLHVGLPDRTLYLHFGIALHVRAILRTAPKGGEASPPSRATRCSCTKGQ